MLEFVDLSINDQNLRESVIKIARQIRQNDQEWTKQATNDDDDNNSEIQISDLNGGITNKLVACYLKSRKLNNADTLLFRLYGTGTDKFISRAQEIATMTKMKQIGLGPEVYAKFGNGICYEYLPGKITTREMCLQENIFTKIAQAMAKHHGVKFDSDSSSSESESGQNLASESSSWFSRKGGEMLGLVKPDYQANMPNMTDELLKVIPSFDELTKEHTRLDAHLTEYAKANGSLTVYSHNDLLLANIIYDETTSQIKFIDYEYGASNYQGFDLANHFNEFAGVDTTDYSLLPDKEYQLKWIRVYLKSFYGHHDEKKVVDEAKVEQFYVEVSKFTLASHLFWATWSLVQAQSSQLEFDFVKYASIRFGQYFKTRDEIVNMS